MRFPKSSFLFACFAALALASAPAHAQSPDNPNLAFCASNVAADSEYSGAYSAYGAIDGIVPPALKRGDDGKVWCVRGSESKGNANFTLTWDYDGRMLPRLRSLS